MMLAPCPLDSRDIMESGNGATGNSYTEHWHQVTFTARETDKYRCADYRMGDEQPDQ